MLKLSRTETTTSDRISWPPIKDISFFSYLLGSLAPMKVISELRSYSTVSIFSCSLISKSRATPRKMDCHEMMADLADYINNKLTARSHESARSITIRNNSIIWWIKIHISVMLSNIIICFISDFTRT